MERRDVLKYLGMTAGASLGVAPLKALAAGTATAEPSFLLNQLGYLPVRPKVVTVRGFDPAQANFRLRAAATGEVVWEAALTAAQMDTASGDSVRQAIFTSVSRPGDYLVEIAGVRSDSFRVHAEVYTAALRTTVRSYTGQRCGCKVDLGGGYQHPACHLDGAYGATSGKTGSLRNAGGWHDAGDYGRYVVNSGITCGTLLWAWE
ncbi:MAG: cellulase N-terminal Ig-like domain-containing protein, partial [Janthinobacterium lividum]